LVRVLLMLASSDLISYSKIVYWISRLFQS